MSQYTANGGWSTAPRCTPTAARDRAALEAVPVQLVCSYPCPCCCSLRPVDTWLRHAREDWAPQRVTSLLQPWQRKFEPQKVADHLLCRWNGCNARLDSACCAARALRTAPFLQIYIHIYLRTSYAVPTLPSLGCRKERAVFRPEVEMAGMQQWRVIRPLLPWHGVCCLGG